MRNPHARQAKAQRGDTNGEVSGWPMLCRGRRPAVSIVSPKAACSHSVVSLDKDSRIQSITSTKNEIRITCIANRAENAIG